MPLRQWLPKLAETFEDLVSCICSSSSSASEYLVIYQRSLHDHPPAGLISRVRILVSQNGGYELQVLLQTIKTGTIDSEEALHDLVTVICGSSLYKFCPGLNFKVYEEQYANILRYDSKSVKLIKEPYARAQSYQCQLWHKLAKNASIFEKDEKEVLCQPCKKMRSHLDQRVRESEKATPAMKSARLEVSSKCPMTTLSPASQKKRKGKLLKERSQLKRRMEHMEITLDDDQSDEMTSIVNILSEDAHRGALNEAIDRAQCQKKGDAIRELWHKDLRTTHGQFSKDQAKNGESFLQNKKKYFMFWMGGIFINDIHEPPSFTILDTVELCST